MEEIEQTDFRMLLPAWTIHETLERSAADAPAKPAIVALDRDDPLQVARSLSYGELLRQIRATANRLREVSGGAVPVISILTPLLPEAFIALWAGATAGVSNPINPYLRFEHVAGIMNAAGTTVLVCGTEAHGDGAWRQLRELRARVPTLRAVWVVGGAGEDAFDRQVAAATGERLQFAPSHDDMRAAVLLHTGGTTAAPKLVQQTQRGLLLNAWCSGAWQGCKADAVVANGMPIFHVSGATLLGLCPMLFGQTMLIVGPDGYRSPRVIAGYWDLIDKHGASISLTTPTTAAALVAAHSPRRAPRDYVHSAGGSAVPLQTAREFEERFATPLHEVWGMTELHGGLVWNPTGARPRLGSIGIPFPYHRARCVPVGAGGGDEHPVPSRSGVLTVNGPCVTPGYLQAAQNHDLFIGDGSVSWLVTGDLAKIDEDGYIWLQGRSKDLIIRGGHNIDPMMIEAALLAHPSVLLAAAVGEPDRDKGELPVAYAQLRPGARTDELELLAHCRREISERAAVPREVRIIDAMPLTAVGKIFKPALRRDATERCVRRVLLELGSCEGITAEVRESGGGFCVLLCCSASDRASLADRIRCVLERYALRVDVDPPSVTEAQE
ncbi:MAG TPA: AMP-binding protein [Steroidobacteraceae bacterium]|nr:AMP-binding protein [Steroidobacteraceae bacterium]